MKKPTANIYINKKHFKIHFEVPVQLTTPQLHPPVLSVL